MKRFVLAAVVTVGLLAAVVGTAAAQRTTSGATSWAVVNTDGSLARGAGAVASAQTGTQAFYLVTFNKDVSQCAYTASGGTAASTDVDDNAVVFTVNPATNPDQVLVEEYDAILGFDSFSSGFHLIVAC